MAKKKSLRARTRVEQNAFVKGLITEASPLTFPDNASLAEENFVLNRDGSRQRRLGMDYERGYGETSVSNTYGTLDDTDTFVWKNAANNKSFDIAVVKVKDYLYFFDNNAESVSNSPLNQGIPVHIPSAEINAQFIQEYDYAFIQGFLVVTTGGVIVYILEFDLAEELAERASISISGSRLVIRDLFGIEEGVEDDVRLDTISEIHRYNLRNQGWLPELQCSFKGTISTGLVDTIDYTFTNVDVYPSNADMVWANKARISGNTLDPNVIGTYDPFELSKSTYGQQEAPKGHYLIDLFERGLSRETNSTADGDIITGYPTLEETVGGIVAVTDFMGRAVYATNEIKVINPDDNSPSTGSMILFSQAKDKKSALTKCHTTLDPTAGEEFANLATDGGFIIVTGIGEVNSLESHANSLFIFSDRGVWQINGGDRLFTMTNVNQQQLTNVGSVGKNSAVKIESDIMYLSHGGIYHIQELGQDGKAPKVVNITQESIQSFYDNLSAVTKSTSRNYYDRFTRQVKWLFADKAMPNPHYFNTELILDLNLGAFYLNKIKELSDFTKSPYIIGYNERASLLNEQLEEPITADGVPVYINEGTPQQEAVVNSVRQQSSTVESSNKYWFMKRGDANSLISVAQYNNLGFRDWQEADENNLGVDANAFLLTGHATAGQSSVFKRLPYITTFMKFTDTELVAILDGFSSLNPSSCSLQVHWGWTTNPDSGVWSNPQEIYRLPRTFVPDDIDYEYGYSVVSTKSRLRGKGLAFSLLYKTAPFKDCHLYGWSLELDAETSV